MARLTTKRIVLDNAQFDGATVLAIPATGIDRSFSGRESVTLAAGVGLGRFAPDFPESLGVQGVNFAVDAYILEWMFVVQTGAGGAGDGVDILDESGTVVTADIIDLSAGTTLFSSVRRIIPAGWRFGIDSAAAAGAMRISWAISRFPDADVSAGRANVITP